MTTDVQTCDQDSVLDDLMKVMTEHRVRHVPVVTDGKPHGDHQHR